MSASDDARIKATELCLQAAMFYSKKLQAAKSNDDACYYGLYVGGSEERDGYVLSFSANQPASKKSYALGDYTLDQIIAQCTDQPNIVKAAKAIRRNSHSTSASE